MLPVGYEKVLFPHRLSSRTLQKHVENGKNVPPSVSYRRFTTSQQKVVCTECVPYPQSAGQPLVRCDFDSRGAGPNCGFTRCSLLWVSASHKYCQSCLIFLRIVGLKFVTERAVAQPQGLAPVDWVVLSARTSPSMSQWPDTQHMMTPWLDVCAAHKGEYRFFKTGFLCFLEDVWDFIMFKKSVNITTLCSFALLICCIAAITA